MAIEIIVDKPPNYDEIVAVFPSVKFEQGIIYSWGRAIYNPDNIVLTPSLRAHENVHSQRQLLIGLKEWWDKYLKDVDFRFGEEVPAHHAEYKQYCATTKSAKDKEWMLNVCATRLAGALYGGMVALLEARRLVRVGKT